MMALPDSTLDLTLTAAGNGLGCRTSPGSCGDTNSCVAWYQ